jgi:hypothetical protein
MSEKESNADRRRRTWTGGVAKSFEEMEEIDLEWSLRVPREDRVGYVFDLWGEQLAMKGPGHEAPSRLPRDVGGVRPRGR